MSNLYDRVNAMLLRAESLLPSTFTFDGVTFYNCVESSEAVEFGAYGPAGLNPHIAGTVVVRLSEMGSNVGLIIENTPITINGIKYLVGKINSDPVAITFDYKAPKTPTRI